MSDSLALDNWHAVFVETGEEGRVKERLEFKFEDRIKILVPKRKLRERKGGIWHEVTRVLFPGYVLINGDIDTDDYYVLKSIPGILRLLRSGNELLSIEPREMEIIGRLAFNDEVIGFSKLFVENNKVRVVEGPLFSMEGLILSVDKRKGRVKVRMNFIGEERTVEFGVTVLEPVDS